MDSSFETISSSSSSSDSESTDSAPISRPSGIKLVLPSLKSLQASAAKPAPLPKAPSKLKHAAKSKKKRFRAYTGYPDEERKAARPVKLKPLKEVLSRLITQIQKKDDYAFFLHPVNISKVPGYTDVVKRPMDFGTMALKVKRGKYRSLEDFASDFRLVTSNAKAFNPPESIYHTEADKIETWGLDQISRAASTVIQYETNWDIDVENDDNDINMDEDNSNTLANALADPDPSRESSVFLPWRRTTRAALQQKQSGPATSSTLPEIEDGRLPGSKEGLGAFPPGSDWAKVMLALKLKGLFSVFFRPSCLGDF
jgi:bromodomain-containing protein 7